MMHTEVTVHLIECNTGHISDKVSATHLWTYIYNSRHSTVVHRLRTVWPHVRALG